METIDQLRRPSKADQKVAIKSYSALMDAINNIHSSQAEIEIEETKDKITIPLKALKFLSEILKAMSEGKPISLVPLATEVTTQKASEILGCSRPFFVKLLEDGEIEYTKVGKHRRVTYENVLKYKHKMKVQQKKHLIEMMNSDDELGLYDS